jgi:hypothetical protein
MILLLTNMLYILLRCDRRSRTSCSYETYDFHSRVTYMIVSEKSVFLDKHLENECYFIDLHGFFLSTVHTSKERVLKTHYMFRSNVLTYLCCCVHLDPSLSYIILCSFLYIHSPLFVNNWQHSI